MSLLSSAFPWCRRTTGLKVAYLIMPHLCLLTVALKIMHEFNIGPNLPFWPPTQVALPSFTHDRSPFPTHILTFAPASLQLEYPFHHSLPGKLLLTFQNLSQASSIQWDWFPVVELLMAPVFSSRHFYCSVYPFVLWCSVRVHLCCSILNLVKIQDSVRLIFVNSASSNHGWWQFQKRMLNEWLKWKEGASGEQEQGQGREREGQANLHFWGIKES